jgi:hypothetical protein
MEQENHSLTKSYIPSKAEIESRDKAYGYLKKMIELKEKPMPHFSGPDGERSWNTLVDDSEKILNGYTLSKEEQGKESWQSNMMDNLSRAKMKAISAGVGLRVPDMRFSAKNKSGLRSNVRAEIFKNIVKQSFISKNPTLSAFKEVWHMLAHGTVFTYIGYQTGGAVRDKVISFDSLTGEIKTQKEFVKMDGKPFTVIINPQEFFWWTFNVSDVQDQPRIAWVQNYNSGELELEFSKYKNYKYVRDKKNASSLSQTNDSTFFTEWTDRVEDENDYEVFRLFDKERNSYEIYINGILILKTPFLWGEDDIMYPFGVQVAEYYANTNFFTGMPFGQIMEAYQEHKNTVINTLIDKLYRSAKKPYLYGLANKDLFDIQDQFIDEDNRFYVPDINQVKPFPYEGPNQGEFAMLSVLDRGLEMSSVDRAQQGLAGGGDRTARETVIADQRAQEIKGSLYLALENLWLQKTRLMTLVVMSHYLKDKAVSTTRKGQIITIEDYSFADGARGVLDIHVAKSNADLMTVDELNSRGEVMEAQGIAYKIISIKQDYLNDWEFDFTIIPESFHQKERALEEAEFDSEVEYIVSLHPEFYTANKDKYLKEKLAFRGKLLEEYNPPAPPQPSPVEQMLAQGKNPDEQTQPSALMEGEALLANQ